MLTVQSEPPISPLSPGHHLDRYELLCPIAQGGMAQVWLSRLQGKGGFEKLVAIKTILSQHAADPRFQKMFLDEARIAAMIRHPNVAQILDVGEQHSVFYHVLEWIEGDSLSALRSIVHGKAEKLPLNVVLRIMSDACAGLHAAHDLKSHTGKPAGVVHRDVSPANILLSTAGEVKLIDFGIAKAMDRISEDTSAGLVKGKVNYMAPEQALGSPVDPRTDLWAIGAVLYHLVSGRPPYQADSQVAALYKLASGVSPPPLEGVPDRVQAIVTQALSPVRENRFDTAHEMRGALEDAIASCCGPTTCDQVAAYVNRKMGDRIEQRRRLIQRAQEAASDRSRAESDLQLPPDPEPSAVPRTLHTSVSMFGTAALGNGNENPTQVETSEASGAAALGSSQATGSNQRSPSSVDEFHLEFDERSPSTLGSTAVETTEVPRPSNHRAMVLPAAVALTILFGVGGWWLFSRPKPKPVGTTAPSAVTASGTVAAPDPSIPSTSPSNEASDADPESAGDSGSSNETADSSTLPPPGSKAPSSDSDRNKNKNKGKKPKEDLIDLFGDGRR